MIISFRNKFVFMHNPKVAGTSIRKALEPYRDTDIDLYGVDPDSNSPLHNIDRAHLSIEEFSNYYPKLWNDSKGFHFYVLYRNPKHRFLSSLREFSTVYSDIDLRFAPSEKCRQFIMKTIDDLAKLNTAENTMNKLKYTHFKPQWIYFSAPNHNLKIHAYNVNELSNFNRDISKYLGEYTLEFKKDNASDHFMVPNLFAYILSNNSIRKFLGKLPGSQHGMNYLKVKNRNTLGSNQKFGLDDKDIMIIDDFVKDFYAKDYFFINKLTKG